MALQESDDEFGDAQSFEYDEAFESQLQIIESRQAQRSAGSDSPVTVPNNATADRASATRRKLEHLEISLETEAADDDLVDELVGEQDQELLDVLNISGSQASKYEDELVQEVTQLIPGTEEESIPNTGIMRDSEATVNGAVQETSVSSLPEEEQPGTRKKSLFQKFRKRGFFSVTDLVAPSWCEVQVCGYATVSYISPMLHVC